MDRRSTSPGYPDVKGNAPTNGDPICSREAMAVTRSLVGALRGQSNQIAPGKRRPRNNADLTGAQARS